MDTSEYILKDWYDANPDIEKAVERALTDTSIKKKTVPCGYTEDVETRVCTPDPEVIEKLMVLMGETKWKKCRSLRDSQAQLNILLEEKGMKPITSVGGMSNIFKRLERKLGIFQGTETTLDERTEKRKKRILKQKALGITNPYHFARDIQKRVDAQKKLTEKNKELVSLKKREKTLKASAASAAATLKKKGNPLKEAAEELADTRTRLQKDLLPSDREVAFAPNPGPQTDFLASDECAFRRPDTRSKAPSICHR